MDYLLVQNREQIILGPMQWKPRYIQSELNDLVDSGEKATKFTISPTDSGYVDCSDGYELIPVTFTFADHDPVYQYLEGPFYTYEGNTAIGAYNVHDGDIASIKGTLINQVATERYRRENAGTTVTIQGQEISVDTSRDNRNTLIQAFLLMDVADTLQWKFPEGFVNLTYTDIETVVKTGALYIQEQFNWEKITCDSIQSCVSIEELKAIVIVEPAVPMGV